MDCVLGSLPLNEEVVSRFSLFSTIAKSGLLLSNELTLSLKPKVELSQPSARLSQASDTQNLVKRKSMQYAVPIEAKRY